MRVTIILDSGGFLNDDSGGPEPLDVGYFETAGASDIEVSEDRKRAQPLPNIKLGSRNERIEVQHVDADGKVKYGVKQSPSFRKNILKKDELYPNDTPDFIAAGYDCILRFNSGEFRSADVRPRFFKEYRLSDHGTTGKKRETRPIANDIFVHFDLDVGEELRLRRDDGTDVWSSSSVGSAIKKVKVKLLADPSLDGKYFGQVLAHKGQHYHRPNPDPPPMNGNRPPEGGEG